MFEGNASYFYVANVARSTDTLAGMAAGSVAIVNEANVVQTSTIMSTNANYRVAQKLANGTIIFSPFFNPTKIKNVVGKSYDAPVQQVTYVGYNGSTGALDATANQSFTMFLEWTNTMGFYNNRPLVLSSTYYTSTASQSELALGLAVNLVALMKRQSYGFIKIELVNNAPVTATNGTKSGQEVTVVNGSYGLTFETDVTYTSGGTSTLAVGDYLRLGSVGSGTALTSPVYKVTAISGTTVTVDRPITNASGTYDDAGGTSDIEVIPAASIGANWGFKFTGVDNSTFYPIHETYSLTKFNVMLNDSFVTGTVTYSTKPYEGSGYWKKLANQEVYSQYLDKSSFTSSYPRNNIRQEISSSYTYDVCSFDVEESAYQSPTTGIAYGKSFKIQIASVVALNGDGFDAALGLTV